MCRSRVITLIFGLEMVGFFWSSPAHGQEPAASKLHIPKVDAALHKSVTGPVPGIHLEINKQGDYVYRDSSGGFSATISRDGNILFRDRWKRSNRRNPASGTCCGPPPPGWPLNTTGPGDWIYALSGSDVYARKKGEILKKTRALRQQLAVRWMKDQIAQQLNLLGDQLFAVISNSQLSLVQKRSRLFELWDDCDELSYDLLPRGMSAEARSEIDRIRIESAEKARRQIELFVQTHLKETSAKAFTDRELANLNARRRSQEVFAPYTLKVFPSKTSKTTSSTSVQASPNKTNKTGSSVSSQPRP